MALLEIVKYGDPVLRKKAEPITEITDDIFEGISDTSNYYSNGFHVPYSFLSQHR